MDRSRAEILFTIAVEFLAHWFVGFLILITAPLVWLFGHPHGLADDWARWRAHEQVIRDLCAYWNQINRG